MFIFYSVHYPQPDKEELFAENMRQFDELMKQQIGIVFVSPYPFKDPERGALVGISIWESQEAFQAAIPNLKETKDYSFLEWEAKTSELYLLNSTDCNSPVFVKW